jgi:hypothetical protein
MSDEPDTGKPARRPTGRETSAIRQKEIDAEAAVKLAAVAAESEDKARNDQIALLRAFFDGVRGLMPTWRAAVVGAAVVLGLAALGWGGKLAFSAAGLGLTVGEGRPAEFDAHRMVEGNEDTDGGAP